MKNPLYNLKFKIPNGLSTWRYFASNLVAKVAVSVLAEGFL